MDGAVCTTCRQVHLVGREYDHEHTWPYAPATQHRVIPVEWHRVAVEPGDNAPARVGQQTADGLASQFCKEMIGNLRHNLSVDKARRAAQPANTDDRQADTIPDELREMYDASESAVEVYLIQRTGRAETRIEVLEAALRESREILEEMRTGTKHHPTLCSPSGDYKCPLCKRIAALAAPSGEKP